MALKRWIRIAGPVVAALAVAIAILPPRVPSPGAVWVGLFFWGAAAHPQSGRSEFASDVRSARQIQAWRLRRALLADSIRKAARGPRAVKSKDGLVTVVYEKPLTADSARFWLEAAARELALSPRPKNAGLPLVVALLSDPARDRPRRGVGSPWGIQELVEQTASAGACVVTVGLIRRLGRGGQVVGRDAEGHPVSRILGACALYARFGPPGPGTSRWAASSVGNWAWVDPVTPQLVEARHRVRKLDLQRVEGYSAPWYGVVRWLEVGCLEGSDVLCLRTAGLDPESYGQDPTPFYYRPLAAGRLLAYLVATGNVDQFAAFWRSGQRPAEALASAYGRPAGSVVKAALEHWYAPPAPPAPWGSARGLAAGLVWLGLALAVAFAASRRWTAEV